MKEKGVVTERSGEKAVITVDKREACAKCSACRAGEERRVSITGADAAPLEPGDRVEVTVEGPVMMAAYILLYIVPLLAFVAAIFLTYLLSRSPLTSFAAAVAATVIAYIGVGIYIRRKRSLVSVITVKKVP